jgi:hypothetical protein
MDGALRDMIQSVLLFESGGVVLGQALFGLWELGRRCCMHDMTWT